jgi:alpha-beta hydrolase superfamily lysophospholipase
MKFWILKYKAFGCLLLMTLLLCSCFSTEQRLDDKATAASSSETEKISQQFSSDNVRTSPEDHSIDWFHIKASQGLKGIALVIHGLNLRPGSMESIIRQLTYSGIDVLNLSLRGHGRNYSHLDNSETPDARLEAFKTVSYQLWRDEVYKAYQTAENRSLQKSVSLFFVGFSLGALMGVDLLASFPQVRFDRMVLFAPAIQVHSRYQIAGALSPFPGLTLPSLSVKSYRANDGTPVAAYNALFDSLEHLDENLSPKIDVPTLIFIDKKDEFVSFNKLKTLIERENLDQWKFHIVKKEANGEPGKIHHLIIDEASTGKDVWREMMDVMTAHLLK